MVLFVVLFVTFESVNEIRESLHTKPLRGSDTVCFLAFSRIKLDLALFTCCVLGARYILHVVW